MYTESDIIKEYKEIYHDLLDYEKLKKVLPTLNFLNKNVNFDEIELLNTIDVLFDFCDNSLLNKINNETITLLIKILGTNNLKNKILYFPILLKHLLFPYNLNKCNNEFDIIVFLSQFDFFTDLMCINLNKKNLELVKKYNVELYELIKNYKIIIKEYENSQLYKKISLNDKLVINATLSHLKTILYFNLSLFDYKYELMYKVFNNIITNYIGYLYECCQYDIYSDTINLKIDPHNILNEYKLCYDLINQEYNESIKKKRM